MKTTLLLILLAICSSFASADPIIFTNQYGSVTVNTFGIQSTQSELTSFDGIKPTKGALGYVNYGTGALVSGSIADGGTFSSQGSYFDITGVGKGVPHGAIFTGEFVGPISWVNDGASGLHDNNLRFTLSGDLEGTLYNGRMVSGFTSQTIYSTNGQLSQGIGHIQTGISKLTAPEPNEMLLFGSGIIGIAGMVKRKISA
jgi:hypothetical protein